MPVRKRTVDEYDESRSADHAHDEFLRLLTYYDAAFVADMQKSGMMTIDEFDDFIAGLFKVYDGREGVLQIASYILRAYNEHQYYLRDVTDDEYNHLHVYKSVLTHLIMLYFTVRDNTIIDDIENLIFDYINKVEFEGYSYFDEEDVSEDIKRRRR